MASRTAAGVAGYAPTLKPISNAAKGNRYKLRTKEWLQKQGYVVEAMEHLHWIRRGGDPCGACGLPPMFPVKRDVFGADLFAIRQDQPPTLVQVKMDGGNIAAAVRKFREYPFPSDMRLWIVIWEEGARQPRVVDAATYALPDRRQARRAAEERLF